MKNGNIIQAVFVANQPGCMRRTAWLINYKYLFMSTFCHNGNL